MTATARKKQVKLPKAGTFLTDGKLLVEVRSSYPDEGILVEDAATEEIRTIKPEALGQWRTVTKAKL